jgi:hypothetical protein
MLSVQPQLKVNAEGDLDETALLADDRGSRNNRLRDVLYGCLCGKL